MQIVYIILPGPCFISISIIIYNTNLAIQQSESSRSICTWMMLMKDIAQYSFWACNKYYFRSVSLLQCSFYINYNLFNRIVSRQKIYYRCKAPVVNHEKESMCHFAQEEYGLIGSRKCHQNNLQKKYHSTS